MNRCLRLIRDKAFRLAVLGKHGFLNWMSDEQYLKARWRAIFHEELNLEHPQTYTEKLQWLKIHDRKPIYTTMVDKLAARDFVKERIGEEYLIPILASWDRFEDIDLDQLPEQFVLKCTHDSGSYYICRDKSKFNRKIAKKKLKTSLNMNYFPRGREWPYKNAVPRIIAEPYLEDTQCKELRDYKFFTFGGVPKVLYITQGRGGDQKTTADFFDMEFRHLDITIDHEMSEVLPQCPKNFVLMQDLAARLSQGTPQLRVDFYEVNGKVLFGELTFFHCSGFATFNPPAWNKTFGDWIELSK